MLSTDAAVCVGVGVGVLCRYLNKVKGTGDDKNKEFFVLGFRTAIEVGVERVVRFVSSLSQGLTEPSDDDIARWVEFATKAE
jgi:hypothetical protein